jgi:Uma2 family endonuclease
VTATILQPTLDAFLKLPETSPASEFMNGQVVQKPMPQGKHSALQFQMATAINAAGIPQQIAYAFPELRCTFENRSIVPDIAVFYWHHIPFDNDGDVGNAFTVAPDWTIEILSPGQSQTKVTDNILFCLRHGTKLGWFIDPEEKAILCFQPGQLPEIKRQPQDSVPVLEGLDLTLTVEQIFNWLKLSQTTSL